MAETTPVASFENTRFHGPRPLETGLEGTQEDKLAERDEAQAAQVALADVGGHLSNTNKTLQPVKPTTKASFIDAVSTNSDAITVEKVNNEVQNVVGSNPK